MELPYYVLLGIDEVWEAFTVMFFLLSFWGEWAVMFVCLVGEGERQKSSFHGELEVWRQQGNRPPLEHSILLDVGSAL
jgi:hypothetical protein